MASKRSNGEGSITRYKDGRWCGRYWTITTDGKKKRVALYGRTKAEVRAKLTKALADRDAGRMYTTENPTVEEYLRRWLDNSVKASVKQKTYESYECIIRKHLIPALGAKKLKNLTPVQVQNLYQQKLDAGLSRRTVRHIHIVLNMALKRAVKWEIVLRNVAEAVDAPKLERKEIKHLIPEQVKVFLRAVKGERLEALYVLAVTTGLRQGELLGLRWQDVDLEKKVVRVRQQLSRSKHGVSFTTPKSNRGRDVPLMDYTSEALRKHRKRQEDEKLKLGNLRQETGLVFTSVKGAPLNASYLTSRCLKPLLERAGLPSITFHGLRHTCATWFGSREMYVKNLQAILGHANISQTVDTYTHVVPGMLHEAVREIENDFF